MASTIKCPYCGASVSSDQPSCPGCGAPNDSYLAYTPSLDLTPKTIAELKDYCAVHQIPLEQLRFCIGENDHSPRLYGIYRDGHYVVAYKNKSDGSRSVRYRGTDEATAVKLFLERLLSECRKQGIDTGDSTEVRSLPRESKGPPKTIAELQAYCQRHGMPLEKMRFFIGQDYPSPRAFGIYRDGKNVVVYKNKSDGSRAIRYQGPDEARGVREIYTKLLDECHSRGIYPDGKPVTRSSGGSSKKRKGSGSSGCVFGCLGFFVEHFFLLIGIFIVVVLLTLLITHAGDGYYRRPGEDRIYYQYASQWYYSDDEGDYWHESYFSPKINGTSLESLGNDWDSDWGVSDFRESSAWDDLHSSSSSDYDSWDSSDSDWSSSSDYDSWDSGGTDWDSDW